MTIAELLKAQGYVTGRGKDRLGDRDEHLPTAHGFGEFYGSLYHLNAQRSPSTRTISKTRRCGKNMPRAAYFIPGRTRTVHRRSS